MEKDLIKAIKKMTQDDFIELLVNGKTVATIYGVDDFSEIGIDDRRDGTFLFYDKTIGVTFDEFVVRSI